MSALAALRALVWARVSVPELSVTGPVKAVLEPPRVIVPVPVVLRRLPVPLRDPESVWAALLLNLRIEPLPMLMPPA